MAGLPSLELGGIALGVREGVLALIVLVAVYMAVVLWRMRRLRQPPAAPAVTPNPVSVAPAPTAEEDDSSAEPLRMAVPPPPLPDDLPAYASSGRHEEALEREVAILREEVDVLRGELAALRDDLAQELGQMRATQAVSPLYGDAMQLARAGYDPGRIAERCGIARAEAELVVALVRNQEQG